MNQSLDDLPMLATLKQAAAVMGPSEAQVRALALSGRLAHVFIGRRLMIPRDAIQEFICRAIQESNRNAMVQTCRVETQVPTCNGIETATAGTSPGLSEAAAGSAALALQTAKQLKSRSRHSSEPAPAQAHVIPLRSS